MPRFLGPPCELETVSGDSTGDPLGALGPLGESRDTSETPELECPICQESMVSLSQLNQHIDDEHMAGPAPDKEGPIPDKEGSKTLRGLFAGAAASSASGAGAGSAGGKGKITREHWQKPVAGQHCSSTGCDHYVDRNGIHCRECGRLFCRPHAVYAKKLDLNAKPDTQGAWYRVCRGCFESREGFNEVDGTSRDLTYSFNKFRNRHTDQVMLRRDKAEKRMVKLINGLTNMEQQSGLLSFKDTQRRRDFEHSIVAWEQEQPITHCRLCGQKFSYFLRKHHCRVCGLVICGDMDRDCSRDVAISLLAEKLDRPDLATTSMYSVRVCKECRTTVFGHRNFLADVSAPVPEYLQLFSHLGRKKQQIDALMPRFQDLAGRLATGDKDPGVVSETKTVRRQLLTSFSQFDALNRRIKDLTLTTRTDAQVRAQIVAWATAYLQDTMLPLQAVPRLLQQEEPRMRKDEAQALQNKLVVLEEQRFMVHSMLESAKKRRRFDEVGPLEMSLGELDKEVEHMRAQLGGDAPA